MQPIADAELLISQPVLILDYYCVCFFFFFFFFLGGGGGWGVAVGGVCVSGRTMPKLHPSNNLAGVYNKASSNPF